LPIPLFSSQKSPSIGDASKARPKDRMEGEDEFCALVKEMVAGDLAIARRAGCPMASRPFLIEEAKPVFGRSQEMVRRGWCVGLEGEGVEL